MNNTKKTNQKVVVDRWAWLDKKELTEDQIKFLKTNLTIYPKEFRPNDKEEPKKIELFAETEHAFAIPRAYYLAKKKDTHQITYRLQNGNTAIFEQYPIEFKGKLREIQQPVFDSVIKQVQEGSLGGIISMGTGTGKCLCADSVIIDAKSGYKYTIDQLEGKSIKLQSLAKNGQPSYEEAAYIWKSGVKKSYKLTLESGLSLQASEDHPILTENGYTKLVDLKIGGFVATSRKLLEPLEPLVITDDEVVLAGGLIADGSLRPNIQIKYYKGNKDIVNLFIKSYSAFLGNKDERVIHYDRGSFYVYLSGIEKWAESLNLFSLSKNKRVPPKFFGLNNKQLALFLKWLFTDGNINKTAVELTLASKGLIDDIQLLLKRYGIIARTSYKLSKIKQKNGSYKEYDAWRLIISGTPNIKLFIENIGCIPGKEDAFEKLKNYVEIIDASNHNFNTNTDIVPITKELFIKIKKESKKGNKSKFDWGAGHFMSTARFKKMCETLNYDGELNYYAKADIYWDRVKQIEEIGFKDVYDLTVPATKNAVVNGIIVHNTVLTLALISYIKKPTLVLVNKEFLMQQWIDYIKGSTNNIAFLPDARIGKAQADICDFKDKHIVIGMMQSLVNRDYGRDFYNYFGMIVTDEAHHIGSETWSQLIPKFPAALRYGLSVGADSTIILKGNIFGSYWSGDIETVFKKLASTSPVIYEGDYEIIDIKNLNIFSRGWNETTQSFDWKNVLKVIRHATPIDNMYEIKTKNNNLYLTGDHSVFKLEKDDTKSIKYCEKPVAKLVSVPTGSLCKGDILLQDNGKNWNENREFNINVLDFLSELQLNKTFVALNEEPTRLLRKSIGLEKIDPRTWYRYKNGKYGFYLPTHIYLKNRTVLQQAKFIYYEAANNKRFPLYLNLDAIAYLLGFWLGDGWLDGTQISFAVEDALVDLFIKKIKTIFNDDEISITIKNTKNKSKEVCINSKLLSAIFRNIFGNNVKCFDKKIPDFLFSKLSIQGRTELLNGLIDSDGSISMRSRNRSRCFFTTTSSSLAKDLITLCSSLNISASLHSDFKLKKGGIVNGRQIESRRPRYNVHWSLNAQMGENTGHKGTITRFIHQNLSLLETPIKHLTKCNYNKNYVYDLEMEGHPSFTANGILVHNSATPNRADQADNAFLYHIGPIIAQASATMLKPMIRRVWSDFKLIPTSNFDPSSLPDSVILKFLCNNTNRNTLIIDQLIQALNANRKIIVLSSRIKHLKLLESSYKIIWKKRYATPLPSYGFYIGGMKEDEYKQTNSCRVIFATYQMVAEAYDNPPLDTLILATPMSNVKQSVGRILRECPGKKAPIVVDIRDDLIPDFFSQAKKREETYTELIGTNE